MVLTTWGKREDGSTIWYPSFYDCDSLLGIDNSGHPRFDAGLDMQDGDYNTSNSRLWEMLRDCYGNQITERYKQLRQTRYIDGVAAPAILSAENIMSYVGDEVISKIGQSVYNLDAHKKYLIPQAIDGGWLYMCNGTREEFTRRWLKERFIYMDSVFQFNYNDKVVIRSNIAGLLKLSLKTYSPKWILISFSDSTTAKLKLKVGKNFFRDFEMQVDNATDNNIEIFGAKDIMFINGIEQLNVGSLNIANAEKITELDISNNKRIHELTLGNNSYLTKLNCSGCTNLGNPQLTDYRTLDLANCLNLKELDCSNTKVSSIKLNPVGGVLEALNCSNTAITTFSINGQEYLSGLSLDGCVDLTELTVSKCNGLEDITMVNTRLSKILVTECEKLKTMDISHTKSLRTFNLAGCPELTTLIMQGVASQYLVDLDLRYQMKLEHLDISSCTFLENITFGQKTVDGVLTNFNALKTFKCESSGIKSIRFGITSPPPAYLDLSGFDLTDLSFRYCTNVTDIRNLSLTVTNGRPFDSCYNLAAISGNIKFIGSGSRAFYLCGNLATLPTLDLAGLTSGSEMFEGCKKLTYSQLSTILKSSGITNKLTNMYDMFLGCTGIVTNSLAADLFSKCTGVTSIHRVLHGCTGITGSLPADILKPMTLLQNAYYAFYGTNISGALPAGLFDNNISLTTTEGMFSGLAITSAPLETMFQYNISLSNTANMFGGCTSFNGSFSENMFKNNKNLTTIASMFNGCGGMTGTIPATIFSGLTKLQNISSFFSGTKISGTIPVGLLDSLTQLIDAEYLFSGCYSPIGAFGLTGTIPTNFFKFNNNLTRANGVFNGCAGLTGVIPPELFKGKTKLTRVADLFKGCSGLGSDVVAEIPKGFLNDCTLMTDVHSMFQGCSKLTGQIPKRVSTWRQETQTIIDPNTGLEVDITVDIEDVSEYGLLDRCGYLTDVSYMFQGCSGLVSEIPETLLINASRVTSVEGIFDRCFYMYGPIPSKLFSNCINLQNASSAFRECVGLFNYIIDEENPYAISPDLFKNCYNLMNVSSMFSSTSGAAPNGSKLNGELPPDLFANNSRLTNIDYFMAGCGKITGTLDSNLFTSATKLTSANHAFYACSGLTGLGSQLFSTCKDLKNMSYTFWACSNLEGNAPEFWSESHPVKATSYIGCFRGATKLDNYANIPSAWL